MCGLFRADAGCRRLVMARATFGEFEEHLRSSEQQLRLLRLCWKQVLQRPNIPTNTAVCLNLV